MKTEKKIDSSVRIFTNGYVDNSEIKDHSYVGENSRIKDSYIGRYVKIDRNNLIKDSRLENYTYTGPFDLIFKSIIGSFTSISYGVTIGPPEHNYKRLSTHPFIYDKFYNIIDEKELISNDKFKKTLIIGHDVWIGCNSTILRGVTIGNGAIIGANSLVKHDVPPYSIVVGNPARVIKYRFAENVIQILQQVKWWEWDINVIKANSWLFTNEITEKELSFLKEQL